MQVHPSSRRTARLPRDDPLPPDYHQASDETRVRRNTALQKPQQLLFFQQLLRRFYFTMLMQWLDDMKSARIA